MIQLGPRIPVVVFNLHTAKEQNLLRSVKRVPKETLEKTIARETRATRPSGITVFEKTERTFLLAVLEALIEGDYFLVRSFAQERPAEKGKAFNTRFSFHHRSVLSKDEVAEARKNAAQLLQLRSYLEANAFNLQAFENPYFTSEGVEVETKSALSIDLNCRWALKNPDGSPFRENVKDAEGIPTGEKFDRVPAAVAFVRGDGELALM